MPAKKATKGKKASSTNASEEKDIKVQKVSSESESNDGNSEEEVDWVHESNHANDTDSRNARPRKPSVFDFDRDEIAELEKKKVSEISTEELLKVVIRRGEQEKNPVLFGGCGRILKQINGERLASRRGGSNGGYRGQGGRDDSNGGNGCYRGRGQERGRGGNQGFRGRGGRDSQGYRGRQFEDDDDDDQHGQRYTRQDQRSDYQGNRGPQGYPKHRQAHNRSNDRYYQEEEANH